MHPNAAARPNDRKIMGIKQKLCLVFILAATSFAARGQNMSVKTNLLYDATLTANAGFEVGLAPHWSADLSGNFNQWTIRDHKWKHWLVQPEVRYWFCEYFLKHFLALHALGGQFNFGNLPNNISFLGTDFSKLTDFRYQGWGIGAGIGYGYALPLSRNWNLEFEVAAGYVYLEYDRFECMGCGRKVGSDNHHYVGPTKAAINLVYVF